MALVNTDNRKQMLIIILAIVVGIVASALVGNYVQGKINEETTKIAHANETMQKEREQRFSQEMDIMRQQVQQVEAKAAKAAEEAAKAAAQKAQQVQDAPKKKPSLAVRTPSGKRAVTVLIDSLVAVGGLINPGDFVDVIAQLNVPSNRKAADGTALPEPVTSMLFQNLQVLAVNTNLDEPGAYDAQQKERSLKITFAVAPDEAGLLVFADKNGKMELALRSPNEKGKQMLPAATWTALADYILENNGADIAVPAAEGAGLNVETENVQESRPYIQIYRGGREL